MTDFECHSVRNPVLGTHREGSGIHKVGVFESRIGGVYFWDSRMGLVRFYVSVAVPTSIKIQQADPLKVCRSSHNEAPCRLAFSLQGLSFKAFGPRNHIVWGIWAILSLKVDAHRGSSIYTTSKKRSRIEGLYVLDPPNLLGCSIQNWQFYFSGLCPNL